MDLSIALTLNYLYEMQAFCTSIVSRMPDGTIIHGRNLDFDFSDEMRNISFIAQFYRGDEHLFESMMFAGDIGVYTGVRYNAFSISENDRHLEGTIDSLMTNIKMIFAGQLPISWMIRETLTEETTFEQAFSHLVSTKVVAPGYLIMAGIKENEGVVIARNREGPAHIKQLSSTNWFIVQTNDDHFDGSCRERCQAANLHISTIG